MHGPGVRSGARMPQVGAQKHAVVCLGGPVEVSRHRRVAGVVETLLCCLGRCALQGCHTAGHIHCDFALHMLRISSREWP